MRYSKTEAGVDPTFQRKELDDADIRVILQLKESGQEKPLWEDVSSESSATKALWTQWDRLILKDGVMYRKWEDDREECNSPDTSSQRP